MLVETGTKYGESARWAARHFFQAYSIELSPILWARTSHALARVANLRLHQGAPPAVLSTLLPSLDVPALLWLDAHWSLGETAGEDDPCPLLAELEVVLRHKEALWDRYFMAAPRPLTPSERQCDGYCPPSVRVRGKSAGALEERVADHVAIDKLGRQAFGDDSLKMGRKFAPLLGVGQEIFDLAVHLVEVREHHPFRI